MTSSKRQRPQEANPEAVNISSTHPTDIVAEQPQITISSVIQTPGNGNGNGAGLGSGLIDLASVRLDQNFNEYVGVEPMLVSVNVRKPTKQEFIRVHPAPEYRLNTGIVELKGDRQLSQVYLVDNRLWSAISEVIRPVCLFTAITRQNNLFLWRLPHGLNNALQDSC